MPHRTSLAGAAPLLDDHRIVIPIAEHAAYKPAPKLLSPEVKFIAAENRFGQAFEQFLTASEAVGPRYQSHVDKVNDLAASAVATAFDAHGRR